MKTLEPVWTDLLQCVQEAVKPGVLWAHECEDLDTTLLCWNQGYSIEAHVNNEVDNWLIGLTGNGSVKIDDLELAIRPGIALLIPKGASRSIESLSDSFSYLSLHKRRRGMMPTFVK
jgi:mannose-6-phosphate isomerase-like protein (cupin superfamily)